MPAQPAVIINASSGADDKNAARQRISTILASHGWSASITVVERGDSLVAAAPLFDWRAYLRSVRAYLSTVNASFRPATMTTVVLAGGQAVLRVQVTAPSPLGVFGTQGPG